MRPAWALLLLPLAACRPESHGVRVWVRVPAQDARDLPHHRVPFEGDVEVPAGSSPRVLRPHADVEVLVPADEPLPRGIRTQ